MQRTHRFLRFRLRHVLVLTTLACLVLGWYAYRSAKVEREARAIVGKWIMIDEQGKVVTMPSGQPLRFTIKREGFSVDPDQEPKAIDFVGANGVCHAIYRWEHGNLRILEASPGWERPSGFSMALKDLKLSGAWPSGKTVMTVSLTTLILKRDGD